MKISLTFLLTLFINLVFSQGNGIIAYSITPPNDNNEIFLINADGTGNSQLTYHEGRDLGPAWSHDASKIAFYVHSPDETKWSIFVMETNGDSIQQLTNEADIFDNSPTWSPDGTKIAFAREYPLQNYISEIWMMNADGSDQHMINPDGGGPDWSDDGNTITFHAEDTDDYEIYTMNQDGSSIIQLTFNDENDLWPDFSTGGNFIAFQSDRDGNYEIYKMDSNGENQTRLTTHPAIDTGPDWSPDGSLFAFTSFRDGNYEIYTMTANGDNQERLTFADVHAIQPSWRPDISSGIDGQNNAGASIKSGSLKVFPNPSNIDIIIQYSLISSSHIKLAITDSRGNLVKTLVNKKQQKGEYEITWDGINNSGLKLSSGVYYCNIQDGGTKQTAKILFLK